MNKHTPGPWTFYQPRVTPSQNSLSAAFVLGPKRVPMDRSEGFTLADAQLIAAAPDLLEALEEIMGSYDPYEPVCKENADLARAAIAKAKGIQP